MTVTVNLWNQERNESVKGIKKMLNKLHDWIGNQSMIVQIGILCVSAFIVIVCLMAAFT